MLKRSWVLLLMLPLAACASAQAKSPVERPHLEVPPPPPRLIEPIPAVEPPQPEPVGDLPASPANPRPRPPANRETTKPEPPKPLDPPPVDPPPVTPPAAANSPAAPQLRMPNTPEAAQAERQVRDILNRANGILSSIDYRTLSAERRAQYDNAKLMILQGEEAIKAANFDFAKNLAEKAERLAKELQGR